MQTPMGITPEERKDADEALAWANQHSPVWITYQMVVAVWVIASMVNVFVWNPWVMLVLYMCCMILQLVRANQIINHAFAFTAKLIEIKGLQAG